ncbi:MULTISPECIES: transketolase family protein [Pseudothermotoga]|jgi:transketolase|uniref:Transketolase central region n=1 Tax=Pseudothermotoga lettingae (strain ATCC BAA-301 / DSM 14385 / NBRC 107922 / TMO) TaxID=416591 RepID=A8F6V3_PSELT|nr:MULTISPECIES: transketolase C-terminal domain-containing protein [Pseudothermotoga]ABV33887.1 Transketolase central region [Pseudothermotoga lettingae TMO]KUK20548.1 MAG: Transketolase central region [Pseudothermotoga lettingae]MDI3494153.1 transketolase [Pseudothermotoga sp.]MDK2884282.1 transketolase [Pseudothermotoga sp.]GLI49176.1 transketolase, C-terminal subunit [Pseudothermotoga lettingae TMO]
MQNKMAVRAGISQKLLKMAEQDPNIVIVTSDARGSASVEKFFEFFPDRSIEVGIAEQTAVGVAAGLSLCGKKVFVFGPACFYSARSLEQVKNDVAYSGANVKIIAVSGGVSYGPLGSTHHALHDIAVYRAIPNIAVILPSDANQGAAVVEELLRIDKPAYVRVGRNPVPFVYDREENSFHFGKANILREGKDLAIFATGEVVWHALEASKILESIGIKSTVVDIPCIKPLDEDLIIQIARLTQKVLTVEEHSVYGGLGEAICSVLCRNYPVPTEIIAIADEYPITGKQLEVYFHYNLDFKGIVEKAQKFMRRIKFGKIHTRD